MYNNKNYHRPLSENGRCYMGSSYTCRLHNDRTDPGQYYWRLPSHWQISISTTQPLYMYTCDWTCLNVTYIAHGAVTCAHCPIDTMQCTVSIRLCTLHPRKKC